VNAAGVQITVPKLTQAVVPDVSGAMLVNAAPPAVYLVPVISFVAVYAVVVVPMDAAEVYNAI
jgi:hypothetical protein